MDTSIAQADAQSDITQAEVTPEMSAEVLIDPIEPMSTASSSSAVQQEMTEQWHQVNQKISHFLSHFPELTSRFFKQNQKAITNVFLVITLLIALDVVLTVLNTLNHIPLLSTILELIGLGYSLWFANRYLLKAQNRQELMQKIRGAQNELAPSQTHLLPADMSS